MRLDDWVFAFIHGYRYEVNKLKTGEIGCFEPYVRENTLTKPCQVEVVEFNKPYRVVLIFFFDKTDIDLRINVQQGEWNKLDSVIMNLCERYPLLQINPKELGKILVRCCRCPNESIFSLDFMSNVFLICFTHDPRVHGSPFPWKLNYTVNPQEMAQTILDLNLQQA
jgi:hypothetical protein